MHRSLAKNLVTTLSRKSNVMKRKIILTVAAIFGNVVVILGTAAVIFFISVILYHGFF